MMSDLIFIGIGVLFFVLLYSPILRSVQQIPVFRGGNAVVITVCAALLGIIGIYQILAVPPSSESANADKRGIVFILIPYAAMALAILITVLVRFLCKHAAFVNRRRNRKNTDADENDGFTRQGGSPKNKFIQRIRKPKNKLLRVKQRHEGRY